MNVLSVLLLVFCFVCVLSAVFVAPRQKNNRFHFEQYEFENAEIENKQADPFVKILADIISKKLKNKPIMYNFVNKKIFEQLKMKFAPTYKLNAKSITYNHLKMYFNAFAIIAAPVNLFIFDYKSAHINSIPKSINAYYVDSKSISYQTLSLINSQNVNFPIPQSSTCRTVKNLPRNFKFVSLNKHVFKTPNLIANMAFCDEKWNLNVINPGSKKGYIKFDLDLCRYEHIIQKHKKSVAILNIFGEKLYEICNIKAKIHNSIFVAEVQKNTNVRIEIIKYFNDFEKLCLKYFNILVVADDSFGTALNALKNSAIKYLNKTFVFCLTDNFRLGVSVDSPYFFKIAAFKQDYLQRYYYCLKTVYGINFANNNLFCKPDTRLLKQDFEIKYFNAQTVKVCKFIKSESKNVVKSLQIHINGENNPKNQEKVIYF